MSCFHQSAAALKQVWSYVAIHQQGDVCRVRGRTQPHRDSLSAALEQMDWLEIFSFLSDG